MNITLVFDGLQIGGIERVCGAYFHLLNERGHSVTDINLCPQLNQMEPEMPEGTRIEHVTFPRKACPEQYAQLVKRNLLGRFIYPTATITLGTANEAYKVISRIHLFLKDRYDIVIAFFGHFSNLTFVANGFIRAKVKMCWPLCNRKML